MQHSARQKNVLIIEVNSLFGSNLAKFFLKKGNNVYGIAKKPPSDDVLENPNFTLLDIDMAQPIPSHLPQFDLIIHLLSESIQTLKNLSSTSGLTGATSNIISQAKDNHCQVILTAPIQASTFLTDHVQKDESLRQNLHLFLVGDIYGPDQKYKVKTLSHGHHFYAQNELTNLISQAILSDKIILEDEGLRTICPTYIDDALLAFEKFTEDSNSKQVRVIVSESPKTSLSVAYEIQKAARLILNRELKLFFSGPERQVTPEAQPVIRLEYLGFEPKFTLDAGLKNVFEKFEGKSTTQTHVKQPEQNRPVEKVTAEKDLPAPEISASEIEPKKGRALPTPKSPVGLSIRRIALVVAIILVVTIVKTALDVYLGIANLKDAKAALVSGDFEKVREDAQSSEKSFIAANNKYKLLSLPLAPILPTKRNSVSNALRSAQLGATAVGFFAEGAKTLVQNLKIITSSNQEGTVDIEGASANFKKAYSASTQASELAQIASRGKIFPSKINQVSQNFQKLSSVSSTSLEFINFVKDLTGTADKKTYLILLLNNAELRPGGGFIGSYGEITFENGRLANLNIDDIYNIDGQLKEKISPPRELVDKLGVKQLYLRDSNWSLDFAANSMTVRDFYKKETGREVDGVIAVDLTFIQNLLGAIGPVKLADYNEEITKDNLFERGIYHAEVGFTPGSTQKKDFLSALTHTLINKIIQGLASINSKNANDSSIPWVEIIDTTRLALSQKHMLVSFDNQNLSSLVKTKGWDNALPPTFFDPADNNLETRDFLAISEANLGANKANRFISRKVDYDMTIGRDADLVAKLKITYKNNAEANTWPAGTYVDFLRLNVPQGATLFSFQNGDNSDLKSVQVATLGNLAVFSTFVEVPIKETREVTFTYRIPKNIKLESAPTYSVYISKQPGTEKDPLAFTFNLPSYIEVKSVNQNKEFSGKQNLKIETDLSQDRAFQIEVKKK